MTDTTAVEPGKLDIGRVIQQTFGVLGRNFVTFVVLALILVGLPTAVISALLPGVFSGASAAYMPLALTSILSLITTAVLQGALIYGTVQDLNGGKASVAESLATGFRAFLPLIVVSIGFALAVAFGVVLLIVPGIMIACAWCVAVPALVAERRGIGDAFSRSAELTRGSRWRIFALMVIWWIVSLVINTVFGAVVGGQAAQTAAMMGGAVSPLIVAVNTIVGTITALIGATGIAVLYGELRRAREGMGPQWLSEVFS